MNEVTPRAFVFDAYGTLFDVHAAIARHRTAPRPAWTPTVFPNCGGSSSSNIAGR